MWTKYLSAVPPWNCPGKRIRSGSNQRQHVSVRSRRISKDLTNGMCTKMWLLHTPKASIKIASTFSVCWQYVLMRQWWIFKQSSDSCYTFLLDGLEQYLETFASYGSLSGVLSARLTIPRECFSFCVQIQPKHDQLKRQKIPTRWRKFPPNGRIWGRIHVVPHSCAHVSMCMNPKICEICKNRS